ncbi:MAG: hypothetical protein AAFP78_11490, partial [Pseudomonadota bacterium]
MKTDTRPAGAYSPSYVGSILRACMKQYEETGVFQGALTGPSRFIQRRMPTGQQVLDLRERVNIELQSDKAIIYLPWPHPEEVAMAAAESLAAATGCVYEMKPQGEAKGMREPRSARSRAAG